MASWTVAPAVKTALAEASQRWPKRTRDHDGTIGDTSHAARKSDHNPDRDGLVLAFDLTHDPANGCDAHSLVRQAVARRDPRIKYAISQGRIWSKARAAEGWRPYGGSNPHIKHAHVSIDPLFRDDTLPWWAPTPIDSPEELDMDEADVRRVVREEIQKALSALYKTLVVGDPTHPVTLTRIVKGVEK